MKNKLHILAVIAVLAQAGCAMFCDRVVSEDPFSPASAREVRWIPKWKRPTPESPEVAAMRLKLESTVIPFIEFNETPVREAITFIQEQSRIHDPGLAPNPGKGVLMLIEASSPPSYVTLTFRLKDCTLEHALKIILSHAAWSYRVEGRLVRIVDPKR